VFESVVIAKLGIVRTYAWFCSFRFKIPLKTGNVVELFSLHTLFGDGLEQSREYPIDGMSTKCCVFPV